MADVTTIAGWRRVTVRVRGGRRFTLAFPKHELDERDLRDLIAGIVPEWPTFPPADLEDLTDG